MKPEHTRRLLEWLTAAEVTLLIALVATAAAMLIDGLFR
jgi:hypothetical protein